MRFQLSGADGYALQMGEIERDSDFIFPDSPTHARVVWSAFYGLGRGKENLICEVIYKTNIVRDDFVLICSI